MVPGGQILVIHTSKEQSLETTQVVNDGIGGRMSKRICLIN